MLFIIPVTCLLIFYLAIIISKLLITIIVRIVLGKEDYDRHKTELEIYIKEFKWIIWKV